MATLVINYTIPFGANVRIGYKQQSSSGPYTYLTNYPSYNDSPYTISGLPIGNYQIELTTLCPNCSGGVFSDPIVVQAVTL
jgi:hypothetical protein